MLNFSRPFRDGCLLHTSSDRNEFLMEDTLRSGQSGLQRGVATLVIE
jgi:hypothetical protein